MQRPTILSYAFVVTFLAGALFASTGSAATYQEKLAAYRAAYGEFQTLEKRYWAEISRKKDIRSKRRKAGKKIKRKHYVLEHPPVYTGPKRPKHPNQGPVKKKKRKKSTLPTSKQLKVALKDLYGHKLPVYKEKDFKLAYAREAQRYGVSAEQVIGVYALETGGKGPYDLVSGEGITRNDKCKLVKRGGRPLSSALGYFQLLNANTSSTVAGNARGEKAERFSNRLRALAKESRGKRKRELKNKAKMLDRMIADMNKAVARMDVRKNNWNEFRKLGRTKLGHAIHALNLDLDIGPMIQMSKLAFVRSYAIKKGLGDPASDRLELMNLVGYPRGAAMLDKVAITVPTANFVKANEIRANRAVLGGKTVEESVAKIRRVIKKRKQSCGSKEFFKMWKKVT